jgi:hypothetical protein
MIRYLDKQKTLQISFYLQSLESNVSDDLFTANSTLNSTSNLSPQNVTMSKRGFFQDVLPFVPAVVQIISTVVG